MARSSAVEGRATAEELALNHMACSTWRVAFDSVAGHRWDVHADHAEETELMLASLTEACGMRLGDSPLDSWLLSP